MDFVGVTAAALAAAGGKGGLTDVNLVLSIATVVVFLLFAFVLTKLGWKPLLSLIEERERTIRDSVEGAHKANAEAQALLVQHKETMREAAQQREDLLKQAFADADQARANLTAQAKADAEKQLQKAREQIQREKQLAIQEIRGEIADLAMGAAAKIVESSLTKEAQRKLVDEFIEGLPGKH
jgi:F-type H+-transporting ATPase subunit b